MQKSDEREFKWSIVAESENPVLYLSGRISERANLQEVAMKAAEAGVFKFDLSAISQINSCGVREWINFMRTLPESSGVTYRLCSPVIVSQLNMIANFSGGARIESVLAPYVCDACFAEEWIPIPIASRVQPDLPEVSCSKCGQRMFFDDDPIGYFLFVMD